MIRRFGVNFSVVCILLDWALIVLALSAAGRLWALAKSLGWTPGDLDAQPPLPLCLALPVISVGVYFLSSVYQPSSTYKAVSEFETLMQAFVLAALCSAGFLYCGFPGTSRGVFLLFLGIELILLFGWRALARLVYHFLPVPGATRRVVVVGVSEDALQVARMVRAHEWAGLELLGHLRDGGASDAVSGLEILGSVDESRSIVSALDVHELVIAAPSASQAHIERMVGALYDTPVRIRVVPSCVGLSQYGTRLEEFAGVPMVSLRPPAINYSQRVIKRLFDITAGGTLTLLTLPLMAFVALAIKVDSAGPVLFLQTRVGENLRRFTMYKFRSMLCGTDESLGGATADSAQAPCAHKRRDDPRVTRVGRIIRKYSLDELPQLFNVLKGDLSLVGPRPELPWLVDTYEAWQCWRFTVPQGITGWWQVNGRSDKPMHLHTADDLYYVQNYSVWLDMYILVKTPWVVLGTKGAF